MDFYVDIKYPKTDGCGKARNLRSEKN